MFRFEDPIYLWLLLIVPLSAVIRFGVWRQRKKKLQAFGDPELIKEMMMGVSAYRPTVKFWLLQTALALLILMLARPQMGSKISHEKRNGIETIIALDISNSMLCQDVAPTRLASSLMIRSVSSCLQAMHLFSYRLRVTMYRLRCFCRISIRL